MSKKKDKELSNKYIAKLLKKAGKKIKMDKLPDTSKGIVLVGDPSDFKNLDTSHAMVTSSKPTSVIESLDPEGNLIKSFKTVPDSQVAAVKARAIKEIAKNLSKDADGNPKSSNIVLQEPPEEIPIPAPVQPTPKVLKDTLGSRKTYVLDTNLLLQSPDCIFGFDDNEVVVTGTTLQELDVKKNAPGELGYNARCAIKNIYSIIKPVDDPAKDIKMDNGGLFRIETDKVTDNLPKGYSLAVPDNRIVSASIELGKLHANTFLVTNDISMRITAKTCKVKEQEYRNDHIDVDKIYTGRRIIESEYTQNMDVPEDMELNEFALMKSGNKSALCMNNGGVMDLIKDADVETSLCKPRNSAQRFAMRALLAPADEISLVILKGPAGSAKTYLSLAAGLNDTYCMQTKKGYKGKYDKIVITRTNSISDADIGFLPGSLEDKMSPLIAPFTDNLATLLNTKEDDMEQVNMQIQDMFDAGIIEIVSMAYMRGRSLNNAFVIIDEAQNATRSQITTIATRMGLGSKLVVLGDPDQVDNPKLDRRNNGLAYISDKMKGYAGCAQLTFTDEEIVRSDLAMEAARRLAK